MDPSLLGENTTVTVSNNKITNGIKKGERGKTYFYICLVSEMDELVTALRGVCYCAYYLKIVYNICNYLTEKCTEKLVQ